MRRRSLQYKMRRAHRRSSRWFRIADNERGWKSNWAISKALYWCRRYWSARYQVDKNKEQLPI